MWQCKLCNFKNSNSSMNCHGQKCFGIRETDAHEIPTAVIKEKEDQLETVLDYCPVCKKEQYFSKDSRKTFRWRWKCHGCKKLYHRKKDKVKKKKVEWKGENV